MPISVQQKLDLLSVVKDHWLNAESISYAYERELKPAKSRSQGIKIATVIAALLTTASGFPIFENSWLTITTGLITTGLATVGTLFAPIENYQKYWTCRAELSGVKQNLTTFSITLDGLEDVLKGIQSLDQIGQSIVTITQRMPITSTDADISKAQRSFESVSLSRMVSRAEMQAVFTKEADQENTSEQPENAADIIPAVRTQVNKIGVI